LKPPDPFFAICDRCRCEAAKRESGVSVIHATPEKVQIYCGKVIKFY